MKKKIFILVCLVLFLTSCAKKPEHTRWRGEDMSLRNGEPYKIEVQKPGKQGWEDHVVFKDERLIRDIINGATEPEFEDPQPNLIGKYRLLVYIRLRDPEREEIFDIRFYLNNGVFQGPRGESKVLGKLIPEPVEEKPFIPLGS